MLHTLKQFQCPNCNAAFCGRDWTRQNHGSFKFPLLLSPCHHSVCESCLHESAKQKRYSCAVCKTSIDLSQGKDSIADFHPDVHALGILSANRKAIVPSIKIKMSPSQEMIQSLNPNSSSKTANIICNHCSEVVALWQCDECQLNYCSLCFDKAHKNVKSKKKHEVKKIFAELYNTMVQSGCPEHKNKSVEFYCERDDTLTCSHCMLVGDHIGHEVKSLADKNMSCSEDLKTVLQDISEVEKRLKYTEHLLGEVSSSEKIDVSEYIKKVHDRFHQLHSALQLREHYLVTQLENAANLQDERFEKMMLEVSGYQKDISAIKKDAELVIENPCLAVSAPLLLQKLEMFKTIPSYLLPLSPNSDDDVKIDLFLDEEIEPALANYGSVDYFIKEKFHLVPKESLPENYCMDIPMSFLAAQDIDSHSNTTLDNISEDSLSPSVNISKYGIQAAFKYRDFSRKSPEQVVVSNIKDPSCFWIQRYADLRKLMSLSDALNRWCRTHDAQRQKALSIERGDLYLVQFSGDNKWYRGRVKRILEPGETYEIPSKGMKANIISKENRIVKEDEKVVEIFYIDYGNTEVVPISRLLNIQARFLSLPGLAKQCCLHDVAPAGEEWSQEAIISFSKFVKSRPVIMKVQEDRNNIFQVDLSQAADNGIAYDVPVSVRDALVFQEFAIFRAGKSALTQRWKVGQQFLPPERLRANSEINVIVSHVNSPSHFYIQQVSTTSYLSSLIVEMTDTYKNENNVLLHSIFAPQVGMICAAQFSIDKQWYRAEVISLPGGANVEVQYVDFGNSEVINHRFLRKLPDKFCKLNIQAIPCKLADVTYNQEKQWSLQAVEWLTTKASKKQLILRCLGFIPAENKSEAVLFYNDDENEICINALMVEEGIAASCGPNSKEVRRKIEIVPPPVYPDIARAISYESVEEEPPILPPSSPSKNKTKESSIAKCFPESEGKHIEIHVSYIESPGSFYVRIAGDMEKRLEKLVSDMQLTYRASEMPVSSIDVGKSYAVFSEEQQRWYRGTVLSKTDDKVEVQFVDYGMIDFVPPQNIHKLVDKFTVDEEFAIQCELIGILPAGGSTQWSHSACDLFKEIVAKENTLHLNCKDGLDKERKSLPVDLYIEELVVGGALEPTKFVYKNIAKELVSKGLALPIRPPKSANKLENSESSASESSTSDLNDKCPISPPSSSKKELKTEEPDALVPFVHVPEVVPVKPPKPVFPKFRWRPVDYPVERNFKGFVTNIGEDGSVHLHVHVKDSSVVELIKKALQFKYARSSFDVLQYPPPVGEGCIARFPIDNLWYRAEILSIYSEKKIKVNFVDYGNNELVTLDDIRTDIIMEAFPKQCIECTISGIHTGKPGQWDDDLLNFLHLQLVETVVDVEVVGAPDKHGRLPCKLVTGCGISIAELLLSMGFMDQVDIPQEFRTFHKATELREGDIFPVCVTHIDSPNIVFLQRLKISEPKSDYEKEHNKEHDAFLELVVELQDKADTFPLVKDPMPGLACCAKYSHDNQWYRSEIINLTQDGVIVLYVDYGNTETMTAENLRNPENKFIDFPMQIHFCKIYGMVPKGEDWDPKITDFMTKKLCLSGQEIFAKVVVPGKMSEIELLIKDENGEFKLVYQDLIDLDIVVLHDTSL